MFTSQGVCILCDARAKINPTSEVCEPCSKTEGCGTCGRTNIKLVYVEHEDDLWCRDCIAQFPAVFGVRERMMTVAAGSVC